jgi:hypothetical protein
MHYQRERRLGVVGSPPPTCWRCEEPIREFYAIQGQRLAVQQWGIGLGMSALPDTFLCAACTDEIAELSAP